MFNKDNFFMGTEAEWNPVLAPTIEPDYISNSGSAYWYSKNGVIRESNHWGSGIKSTDWYMKGDREQSSFMDENGKRYGYANYSDFRMKPYEITVYNRSGSVDFDKLGDEYELDVDTMGTEFATFKITPSMISNGRVHIGDYSIKFKHEDFMYINM